MKKTFIFLMILGITTFVKAQIVNIPDTKFKAYLVGNQQINTNNDSEIQISEATSFTGTIDVYNKGISSVVGIEFFLNVTTLQCGSNNISSIDISKNTNLKTLQCGNNKLSSLDVSKNLNLSSLWCGGNILTNLDVSKNIKLVSLYCEYNKITSLDLSKNTYFGSLSCGGNQFTSLDLSKNTNFVWLYCHNNSSLTSLNLSNGNNKNLSSIYIVDNPNLTCVQVDDVDYANSQPSYIWQKDATANYNTNCILSVNDINKQEITIYPNPTKENLNFSEEVSNIRISDFSGKFIKHISNSEKSINVSKLAKGTYIISATTKIGETVNKKFIKE